MMERSYIAGLTFLASTTWFAKRLGGVKTLYDRTCSFPMKCSVVGVVASTGLHLDNHGDFSPDNSGRRGGKLRDARFRITLRRPTSEDSPFFKDFDRCVESVLDLVDTLPDSVKKTFPFIKGSDGDITLNFTRPVFDGFVGPSPSMYLFFADINNVRQTMEGVRCPFSAPPHLILPSACTTSRSYMLTFSKIASSDMFDAITPTPLGNYKVAPEYEPYLSEIKDQCLAKNVYVWDRNGVVVPGGCRKEFLENKLVQIYFCMYFNPRCGLVSEFNTISAFEDDVVVWSDFKM